MHGLDNLQKLFSVGAIRRFIFSFFANQDFSLVEIKGRAATQMHRSNTSSEISFHGLPSKSKRPSIRKHSVVVIITVNSISFYETAICREIFSKHFFASTSLKFLQRIRKTFFKKFLENSQKSTSGESYFTKVAGFYRSSQRRCSIKKVS